jgi:hypothetical protein
MVSAPIVRMDKRKGSNPIRRWECQKNGFGQLHTGMKIRKDLRSGPYSVLAVSECSRIGGTGRCDFESFLAPGTKGAGTEPLLEKS